MGETGRVADIHLKLLAEAASDALERSAAARAFIARVADLKRGRVDQRWLGDPGLPDPADTPTDRVGGAS